MTVTVVGTPTSNYIFGTSLTVATPSVVVAGDRLLAWIHTYWNTPVTAAPSGWTLKGSLNQTSGTMGGWWYLYEKTAALTSGDIASPPTYTWTAASQNHWGSIIALRGASGINVGGQNANFSTVVANNSLTISAITPSVANTLLLAFYSARSNDTTPRLYTQPSGMTELLDRADNFAGLGIASAAGPASGVSTGTKIATRAAGTSTPEWGGVLVAIAPDIPVVRSTSNLAWSSTARTTSDIPVPAGPVSGDVAVVHFYTEDSTPTVTAPAGFTELTFSPTPITSSGGVQRQRVFWKRLTGADAGNYSFSHAATITEAVATLVSGCAPTGTPITALASAVINSSSATNPTISGTTTGNDRLLLWCDSHYTSGADVQEPSTFITVRDGRDMHVAYGNQFTAGATGTLTGTITTGSTNNVTTLVELAPLATGPDTTAPTVPTGVTATANSETQVTIAWTASTDAVGVASYRIRRGGTDLTGATAVTGLSFADTTVVAGTAYSYTVSAVDAAGNRSAESTAAPVTTPQTFQGSGTPSASGSASGGGTVVVMGSGTASASGTATGDGTAISLLADNFTTQNNAKWTYSARASVVNGRLNLVRNVDYAGQIRSVLTNYSLQGSAYMVELVSCPTTTAGYSDNAITAYTSGDTQAVSFDVEKGGPLGSTLSISAYIKTAGTWGSNLGTVAYDATAMRWLRIRETGGSLFWETSPDASTWTQRYTTTAPWTPIGLQLSLQAGDGAGETVVWDNFNYTPVVSEGTAAASAAGATTGAGYVLVMSPGGSPAAAAGAAGDGTSFNPEKIVTFTTLTGTFLTGSGTPMDGSVVLTPSVAYRVDSVNDRIVAIRPRVVPLVNGALLTRIPANGPFWRWRCDVVPAGSPAQRAFYFTVPIASDVIDIADCTVG